MNIALLEYEISDVILHQNLSYEELNLIRDDYRSSIDHVFYRKHLVNPASSGVTVDAREFVSNIATQLELVTGANLLELINILDNYTSRLNELLRWYESLN